jgi:hypothetical protein
VPQMLTHLYTSSGFCLKTVLAANNEMEESCVSDEGENLPKGGVS